MKFEQIGKQKLYLGDCEELLESIENVDAIITDPPYGINQDKGFSGAGGFNGSGKKIARKTYEGDWDSVTPKKAIFDLMQQKAKNVFIFGGNYFTDKLPANGHWLVWDKKNTMPTFSDCELVWTNLKKKSVKLFEYESNGMMGNKEKRVHPTQKPIQVMKWVILQAKDCHNFCDPFMGSGSTLVALQQMGLSGIGIEKNEKFFDIACKRIEETTKQKDLFIA